MNVKKVMGWVLLSSLVAGSVPAKKTRPPVDPRFYEPNYEVPQGLVDGAAFQDRFLPVPVQDQMRADVWGADGVLPRDVTNGIEDDQYSYWGGNIVHGADGKEHLFCCRWPEDYKRGHYGYQQSEVIHAVSNNGPLGPFSVAGVIGPGHNPEIYQAKDGSWVIGVLENIGTYRASTLNGPWTPYMPNFIPESGNKKVNLRNRSYARCDDGSVLMIIKNGTLWHSNDGITDFRQITDGVYFKPDPTLPALHEDPVIWKDEVQFNLVYNDARRRQAFYMRSRDGLHWKPEPGFAYRTDMMIYENGVKEQWYKWERPKVRQDKFGRATHMNFAVIDVDKKEDKGNDNHSSKNVVIPLVVPRRLAVLGNESVRGYTDNVRVCVTAEAGFDPLKDIDLSSLRFGAAEEVNFGRGCEVRATEVSGRNLIVIFSGESGIVDHDFAAKLIGKTRSGGLLFGYVNVP